MRISNLLSDNKILEDNEASFRANYRTTHQIFIVKTLLNKYLHKLNKPIYACFVDFSKAFDSVWRDGLFQKLHTVIFQKLSICILQPNSVFKKIISYQTL